MPLPTTRLFLAAVLLLTVCQAAFFAQTPPDAVLYSFGQSQLFDGKFGKLAAAQQAASAALMRCGKPGLVADGRFGQGTANAIKLLATCPALKPRLPMGSPAFQGAITAALWRLLLPASPAPTAEQRAQTLVLTYEATDYDSLEWNFCQSRGPDGTRWSPDDPTKPCFSNDPNSYITWGPRGATAGGGKEVQWIIWRAERQDRALVNAAFGAEATAARKFITLDNGSARQFLCEIFANNARKALWTNAFAAFGKASSVRRLYDRHYLSLVSDGAKMKNLYRLYELLGVSPTEIDYGFFLDRATHSSPPAPDAAVVAKIRQWLATNQVPPTPANTRRAFASSFPTSNQTADRLGRDVAFFLDAVTEAGLTPAERAAWQNRNRLSAANVGLSDERPAPALSVTTDNERPNFNGTYTATQCSASVLNPQRPPR